MNYTKEQLRARFKELPQELKEAIAAVETYETIDEIAKKHGLMLDQAGELGSEIGLALLGFTQPNEFQPQLEARLKVGAATASEIVKEVNEQIFAPVREALEDWHQKEGSPAGQPGAEDIFNQKMSGLFNVPKEEKTADLPIPPAPSAAAPKPIDPYREPII